MPARHFLEVSADVFQVPISAEIGRIEVRPRRFHEFVERILAAFGFLHLLDALSRLNDLYGALFFVQFGPVSLISSFRRPL